MSKKWGGNQATPVGVDDGFNNTKIVMEDGSAFMRPSRAAFGQARVASLNGVVSDVLEYESEGHIYHAGKIEGEPTRHDDYPTSALNRIIVHHTLQMAGLSGKTVDIVSGLPVRMYFEQAQRITSNKKLIEAKIKNLEIGVTGPGGRAVIIGGQKVLPEGFAAWFDYIIDESNSHGKLNREKERESIGIIDIGGRTTDYAVISDRMVQIDASGSIDAGMLNIRDRLAHLIKEKFEMDRLPTSKKLDEAFTKRAIRLYAKEHAINDLIAQAKGDVLNQIKTSAQHKIGKGAELERVLFIGGGVQALGASIDGWFNHQQVVPNAMYANARGMLKYAKYIAPASA